MAATFIARAGDVSIKPHDATAIVPKGVVSVSFSDDSQMVEEFDLDDPVPFHFQGNNPSTVTLETKDFALWFAFNATKCVENLSINVTAPVSACGPNDERVTVGTITGANLVLMNAREFQTGQDGGRAAYSLTFAKSHNADGEAGTLVFEPAETEGGGGGGV